MATMMQAITTMSTEIQNLTNTVTTLSATVTTLAGATGVTTNHTRPTTTVEKPKAFEGKSSESARLFRTHFIVWARSQEGTFAARDANGMVKKEANGNIALDRKKIIPSALSFLTGNASIWARPHLKKIAENQNVFVGKDAAGNDSPYSWTEFIKQFHAKFEPQDAITEAKYVIQNMRQGNRTFADYLADFETWSPRTGWSEKDLFDRLKDGLAPKYIERIYLYSIRATTYTQIVEYGKTTDQMFLDLHNTQKGIPTPRTSSTAQSGFRDPNAMELDATNLDKYFAGITDFKVAQAT